MGLETWHILYTQDGMLLHPVLSASWGAGESTLRGDGGRLTSVGHCLEILSMRASPGTLVQVQGLIQYVWGWGSGFSGAADPTGGSRSVHSPHLRGSCRTVFGCWG